MYQETTTQENTRQAHRLIAKLQRGNAFINIDEYGIEAIAEMYRIKAKDNAIIEQMRLTNLI